MNEHKQEQIADFVHEFTERVLWMLTPEAASVLLSNYSTTGEVNYASMLSWFIMFALDQGQEHGMSGDDLHKVLTRAAMLFASTSFDNDIRAALQPFYKDKNDQ